MNEHKKNMDFQAVQVLRCIYKCNVLLTFLLHSVFSFSSSLKTPVCSPKSVD